MKTDGSDRGEKGKSVERSPVQSLKDLLNSDYVKNKFLEVMGEKAPAFLVSIMNAVQRSPDLAKCDNNSILSSAMAAAILDLPIDTNLGFSAIIPYKTKVVDKKNNREYWVDKAQFQIMYKGFIQLALRSGQYKTINVSPIYEDEFDSYDIVTGDIVIHPVAGGQREKEKMDKIIGYVAFFRLINGFERIEYWSISKIKAHGERFSKSYKNANGLWKKDPHAMYAKTVLKNTISKWGILSVTMQTAVTADQAVINDFSKAIDESNVSYVDNFTGAENAETENESALDVFFPGKTGGFGGENEQNPTPTLTAESQNDTPPVEETAEKTAGQEQAHPAEKPADKKASNAGTGTATEPAAATGDIQGGLFQRDEADALEEQYRQSQAGAYPDFGG